MAKFITENISILELTPETSKIFNRDTLFVAYKMEKNINSLICKNKFTVKSDQQWDEENACALPGNRVTVTEDAPPTAANNFGCFKCGRCTFCNNFMSEGSTFSSPNTAQTFNVKSHIKCTTKNVIYVIYDKICKDRFYVGYTCDDMKTRWSNHKSHIKKDKKTCEIASHFIQNAHSIHKLDKTNQACFTASLSLQLEVKIIECVDPIAGKTIREACELRETFWQGALKSTKLFGGMNKRTNSDR